MIRLIKYVVIIIVLAALYYIVSSAFSSRENEEQSPRNTSNNIVRQTEQVVRNTYQDGMVNLKENVDIAVQSSENLLKQIILE